MNKLLFGAVAASGVMMASPASAQAEYLSQISLQDLQRVVADLDGTSEIVDLGDSKILTMTFDNGIKALAYLNCDNASCTGLNMFASFRRPETTSVEEALRKANDFNADRDAVSAGLDNSNDYFVSRYLIMDHGVAYENLVINVAVFASLAEEFSGI